jgi:hypothetical protein
MDSSDPLKKGSHSNVESVLAAEAAHTLSAVML